MALTAPLAHNAFPKIPIIPFHGEALPSSSSFIGSPFTLSRSSSLCGNHSLSKKQFVVFARKVSGLEEAMNIRRERELRVVTKFKKRPPLKRGRVSPGLPVPDHIPRPPYVGTNILPEIASEHQIHDSEGIAKMRAACELAARVLNHAGTLVRPSITTNEIDKEVHQMIIDAGAYPSPLGYGGFPKSVCTSVNECMCHGIPDSRQLQNGDIINIDVTVYLDGYHGDTSKTFFCGEVSDELKIFVKVTEECLEKGIAACRDGALFRKIGKKISEHAEKYGYGVVERFVGHGVGRVFHSEPIILHNRQTIVQISSLEIGSGCDVKLICATSHNIDFPRNEKPGRMVEGQTFTIEPILSMGSIASVTWPDNWTTLTADGSPAAQFEHTILITKTGAEILTTC